MEETRNLDPYESAAAYFGAEVRRHRTAAGLSMAELGKMLYSTKSMVAMVEKAHRLPTEDFAKRCDGVFGTEDRFARLWPLVTRSVYPKWFRPVVTLEETASVIRTYAPQVVHGLLQTEEYARAVIAALRPTNLDDLVAARIHRQRILQQKTSPLLWQVVDEAVLRRPTGGAEVMRRQLAHLIDAAEHMRTVLQVLPIGAAAHDALPGPLTLMSFDDGPDIAYAEGYGDGELIGSPDVVRECHTRYDLGRADALSPEASHNLIASLLEDPNPWWDTTLRT